MNRFVSLLKPFIRIEEEDGYILIGYMFPQFMIYIHYQYPPGIQMVGGGFVYQNRDEVILPDRLPERRPERRPDRRR